MTLYFMYGREVLANAGMKVRGGGEEGGREAQYEEKPIFVGTNHISIMANRSALECIHCC